MMNAHSAETSLKLIGNGLRFEWERERGAGNRERGAGNRERGTGAGTNK